MTANADDVQQLVDAGAAACARALTRRLDRQAEREADDRGSRLAHGIPDFDRWPVQR